MLCVNKGDKEKVVENKTKYKTWCVVAAVKKITILYAKRDIATTRDRRYVRGDFLFLF